MKITLKRLFSLLLALTLVVSMVPAVHAQSEPAEATTVFTDQDYAPIDAIFNEIDAMEDAPAKKNATETQLSQAAEAIVVASDSYVEGSLERNGSSFTWWTENGVHCVYSPRMRQIESEMVAPENPTPDGIYNEPVATKGGWPSGNQVYLVGPYYGYDTSFSNQYKNEATAIASAIGDTDGYTLYSGKAATVDKVAEAVSKGAVVIFDSHGNTDYENPNDEYDYVTGATSSYLCLKSTSGLTDEDYDDGALYYSDGIWINGATISNHMTADSPAGILWMAICLGMATDTFCTPLRERGVEVVYGYSQSVSFDGDYCFEEVFWDNMCAGKNVAESVSAMKSKYGNWDGSPQIGSACGWSANGWATYSTISAARADYAAFPIVVSDEDTHPGQRKGSSYGADSLQTVKSTYTLFSQYEITAQSNNTSYGTVSISGTTITATPADGYFAESASVVSGTATVSQNGNSFTVRAESDCTVQINFAPKTAVTVSFSGATVASQTGYAGDSMTLPTVTAPEDYTFVGWMTDPMGSDSTEKPACYTDSFIPSASTTLYALYSYIEEGSGTGTGDYVKVTSAPADWSGEYLIVYEADGYILDGSRTAFDATSNYQAVTISSNTISAAQGDAYKFTIAEYSGGYSIQGTSGGYVGHGSNANGLTTGSSALKNTITLDSEGNANIVGSGGAYLRYNATSGQTRFRYYKSSSYTNQKPIALYLKDGSAGTTYYTGNPTKCEHANTTQVAAVAATCTEGGYSAGVYCNDCESYISGHEAVAALGHDWSDWAQVTAPTCTEAGSKSHSCSVCGESEAQPVAATGHSYEAVITPPTTTEQGYTTYTCHCGDSYVADYTEALGEIYAVSFKVPTGVASVASMECGKNGITLPTAAVPTGDTAYAFAGWAVQEIEDTETAPTLYKAGETYTATAHTTLHAVYTYTVGGSGTSEYVLTDISEITATDVVVITVEYTDGTVYALPNDYGTSVPDAVVIGAADGKLTETPEDYLLWNVGGNASGYSFYPDGTTSSWLYCTDSNKGVKVGTGSAKSFVIDAATGYLMNTTYTRYVGVYLVNPDWRCYENTTGNIVDQVLGFYVKTAAGTTYYTSLKTAEPVAAVGSVTYTDINAAIAACTAGQYVKLLADAEAEVILEQDLYIDLNGFDLTGILEPDGHAVYGMDSTTDGYNGDNAGVFSCLDINDQPVVPQTHIKTDVTGSVKRYLAVKEADGYSFHRFYLGITHATVKPGSDGVGYKALFCGDNAVKAQLASYGYSLQVGTFAARTVTKAADSFVSGKAVTLRIENYDVENYGEADLTAAVTLTLTDGTVIESGAYTTTLRQIVEHINANASDYLADQLAALKEMIANNPTMSTWDIGNI